ncbi:hypothetical protein BQ8482_660002 [Mesorhizobium delmotii]|uniref:Microcystin LR degradation protein MlrC N-terminal domain-containing protein n=2 Tax=Mesorhizobium delmotii TaxID=1631247 RepID=A0A2P9AVR4_9HYPH|nr:hypothetical protein BQ8482_660002 [Mesorhizobium delmotii]
MVAEGCEDAEGEILVRLRAILGPDAPIVVTLDLHANVTEKMAANASALIAVRTYPHIDLYEAMIVKLAPGSFPHPSCRPVSNWPPRAVTVKGVGHREATCP